MSTRRPRQRGVTLIELILFIVIVSIALVGVLQVMRLTTANSADPVKRKQALMLAEAMLEEVQLAKFTYCDPTSPNADDPALVNASTCNIKEEFGQLNGEPVGARPYDNVNDYVTAADDWQPAFNSGGVLTDANGHQIDLPGYAVWLMITPELITSTSLKDDPAHGNSANVDVLRISVKVTYDNQTVILDGYRTRYAPQSL